MMKNMFKWSDQKGTLLVEALAMLGLIAMVTPTLYKKSAERLQEIQDINGASQARTMSRVMDSYIHANFSKLMEAMSSTTKNTVVIDYEDGAAGSFPIGYSSFLPYGFKPDEIRNYLDPTVYVHRDKDTLVSYVIYPKGVDLGKKRSARMASLVGANGGVVTETKEAKGTGGAWHLNSSMVNELKLDKKLLTENSLIVTSNEPISMSYDDNAKYLYRVPPTQSDIDGDYYHNTMVTDLYMGGNQDLPDYERFSKNYYSIFNVRKMTMNTKCSRTIISGKKVGSTVTDECNPNIADLYIGKPIAQNRDIVDHDKFIQPNNGAAWIYGNLSALEDNFRLFREGGAGNGYDTNGARANDAHDVLLFSKGEGSSGIDVLRAENGTKAEVSMIDDFAKVVEGSIKGEGIFTVGSSGSLIHAFRDTDINTVYINQEKGSNTFINKQGGMVKINSGYSSGVNAETYINENGGKFAAGKGGQWIQAAGMDGDEKVEILNANSGSSDNRIFTVGSAAEKSAGNMLYGDKAKTSMRSKRLSVFENPLASAHTPTGRLGGATAATAYDLAYEDGYTNIATAYTDILGSVYIGTADMAADEEGEAKYSRGTFTLGVAGSAWVDQFLWARKAWLKNAGLGELHAGFDKFETYRDAEKKGWLNVYKDQVVVRKYTTAGSKDSVGSWNPDGSTAASPNDIMLQIDSNKSILNDGVGAWVWLENGSARVGTNKNYFMATGIGNAADAGSANIVASTLANIYTKNADASSGIVNIQNEAAMFKGNWDKTYKNQITAKSGLFTVQTAAVSGSSTSGETSSSNVQFMIDDKKVRTRYVDLMVEDNSSYVRFQVSPNNAPDDVNKEANVMVDGSFHVTGNEVIHVANNAATRAGNSTSAIDKKSRAMLEIDPEYVQVWSKDDSGNYVGGTGKTDYYAMLKINPTDTGGTVRDRYGSSAVDNKASVYIRKGAIELEPSVGEDDKAHSADGGFGYIKASRIVHNGPERVPKLESETASGFTTGGNRYDKYMVNPAYTSVMHDIKLTSRGGARLSDALPDYVLKGVYNVSNSCDETVTVDDKNDFGSKLKPCQNSAFDKWASPYVGIIPYSICPPGYKQMATLVPSTFLIGQAGDIIYKDNRWVVNPYQRQAEIIKTATSNHYKGLIYPGFEEVSSMVYNATYKSASSFSSFIEDVKSRKEGWYWGLKAIHPDASSLTTSNDVTGTTSGAYNITHYTYTQKAKTGTGDEKFAVVQPLYFQQNNWLKTSVVPVKRGWHAYLGFLYEKDVWGKSTFESDGKTVLKGFEYTKSVTTNHNSYNDSSASGTIDHSSDYIWNLFPVPINTLEGIANVYCYFDRQAFIKNGWKSFIDDVDQINNFREPNKIDGKDVYRKRLNDPTLIYNDPW